MVDPVLDAGTMVRFSLENVICPDLENILSKATSGLEVTGKVVLLSDTGVKKRYYAVVEVAGIATPLVVPVEELVPTSGCAYEERCAG